MQTFFDAYVECALWSSTANHPDDPDSDASFESAGYGADDIAPDALKSMQADCDAFYQANNELIDANMTAEQAGRDFWLTRNHHGAGFWDRGLGEVGETLTKAAHGFGSSDLYVGHDGNVYVS